MTDFIDDLSNEDTESILDIDTSDSKEPTCVEAGEYKVRITGFRKDTNGKIVRMSDKGNKYFIVTFDIPDEEFSKGLSRVFSVPTPDMEPKRVNSIKWDLDCFKRAFGMSELNFNAMVGLEGWALLKIVSSEAYGEQNEISKFITGPASGEEFDKF